MSTNDNLALVLSGGGARAAYQAGVLSALAERAPDLHIPILTGVSAGAINTVYLAAHAGPFGRAVEGLRTEWSRLKPSRVYAVRPFRLGRAVLQWGVNMLLRRGSPQPSFRGLMDMSPLRGFLAACIDVNGIQRNLEAKRLQSVALSATCYDSGQTVTFMQGKRDVPIWERPMRVAVRTTITIEHLLASASIPLIFPAFRIGNSFYGDGSVRQTAPLAPAIHLGASRIIGIAMRTQNAPSEPAPTHLRYPVAAEVFGILLHSIFLDSLDADAERLQRINTMLRALPENSPAAQGMRPIDLLLLRPSRDLGSLAGEMRSSLPMLVQLGVSSIGGERAGSSDFLSYLMFQPKYTGLLMELGYEDGRARLGEIEDFLGKN
ncbi:MAG: patatin-like phospholipase family protein [Gemmatimonadota bacterium]|nr:patatin-like phospholipase family protein [Gemmatimonadota bacterium]